MARVWKIPSVNLMNLMIKILPVTLSLVCQQQQQQLCGCFVVFCGYYTGLLSAVLLRYGYLVPRPAGPSETLLTTVWSHKIGNT